MSQLCTIEDAWLAGENTDSIREDHLKHGGSVPRREPHKQNTLGERPWKKKKTSDHPRTTHDILLDKPFPIHAILINPCPTHNLRDCWVVKQIAKGGPALLAGTPSHIERTSDKHEVMMIYETFVSNNQRKRALREINSIQLVPIQGVWIDTPITFDHHDQPRSTPIRCPTVLVLNPIIDSCRFRKVLMDGDSSLNLIYAYTLDKMHIDKSRI